MSRRSALRHLPRGIGRFPDHLDARGEKLAERMLSRAEPSFHFSIPAAASETATAVGAFFQLGILHILTGYDHLLFLFALLLVCRTFREALTIITCFTLAHSLTLALAATGTITLPSRVVESAIALSICYVGLENIFTAGKVRWRGWRPSLSGSSTGSDLPPRYRNSASARTEWRRR